MADMFVHTLVENLKELMGSDHPIIGSKRTDLGFLHNNVSVMSSFLKRTELEKCSADEEVKLLLMKIRDVTYEVENYVDSFVQEGRAAGNRIRQPLKNYFTLQGENYVDSFVQEAIVSARQFCPRSDPNWSRSDRSCWKMLRKLIEAVKIEVNDMNAKLDLSKLTLKTSYKSADDGQKIVRIEDSETVVGIKDTMNKLVSQLTDGSKSMISIVGSPGIGKSTVAQRVFDHGSIKSSFPIRAWSTVSQTYDIKRSLIDILQSSSLFVYGDDGSTADQLGEALLKRLKDKIYLVVLDDVWSIEPLIVIQKSFPDQHNGSRVLLTSRFAAIGKDVYDHVNTHYMSGLSKEDSWNLFKNKVFGQGQCPPELVGSGTEMVRKCDGLPLAIVVTGGLMAKKDKNPEFWEQVASNLAPAFATDQEASFMNTLELSYQHLPVHLKACFLYLGSFPLEYNHSLRSLIWLLIAEGFVIQETEEKSLEVTAEGYLNELVEWSLVTVARIGAMKVVRIHDFLRAFCVARGNQEKFNTTPYEYFNELLQNNAGCTLQMWESILKEQRRLDCYHYRPSNVRSFCSEALTYRHFSLWVLLSLMHNFFEGLGNLVHLRYLSFGSIHNKTTEFALSITKLLNLETLFLDYGGTLRLPDDVWNMVKLRHLYNKNRFGIFHFQACPPQGAVLGNLQTLHTLCGCDSCLTMLVRAPNIRKLGLSRDFRYAPGRRDLLDLCFLKQLETLKVIGSTPCDWNDWDARILPNFKLPASLRKLTLQYTYLRWENISFLKQLPNLEVLKLLGNAFFTSKKTVRWENISYWDTSEVDFSKLKYLKMQGLDIVKWEDQDLKFESLEVLVLDKCERLQTIPFGLAECASLHTIKVTGCTTSFSELAKEIEVEHENMCGDRNLQVFITDPLIRQFRHH